MKFAFPSASNGKLFLIGLAAVVGPWSLYLYSVNLAAKRLEASKKDDGSTEKDEITTQSVESKGSAATAAQIVDTAANEDKRKVLIIYGTCTGTAKKFALEIAEKFTAIFPSKEVEVIVVDAKDYDEFVLDQEDIVLFICSTWTGNTVHWCEPSHTYIYLFFAIKIIQTNLFVFLQTATFFSA